MRLLQDSRAPLQPVSAGPLPPPPRCNVLRFLLGSGLIGADEHRWIFSLSSSLFSFFAFLSPHPQDPLTCLWGPHSCLWGTPSYHLGQLSCLRYPRKFFRDLLCFFRNPCCSFRDPPSSFWDSFFLAKFSCWYSLIVTIIYRMISKCYQSDTLPSYQAKTIVK